MNLTMMEKVDSISTQPNFKIVTCYYCDPPFGLTFNELNDHMHSIHSEEDFNEGYTTRTKSITTSTN